MHTDSIQNPAGDSLKKNKRWKRKERKKTTKTDELLKMDHMDDTLEVPNIGKICSAGRNYLQSNLIELDSTAQSQAEQSKMDTRSTEILAEGTVQIKRKKRKQNKKKAKGEAELQRVHQMDDHSEAPHIGKICSVSTNDLQNNLIELHLTAELHKGQSKMDTRSSGHLAEGTAQIKRKKRKQNRQKAKNEGEVQSVDLMDDHLEAAEVGKICLVPNNDLQNNRIELDSTLELHKAQSKVDTRSTENLVEGTGQIKRKMRKQKKKKAKSESEPQSVDQMDDPSEAPDAGKIHPVANNDLQNNLIELHSTAELHKEQSKVDTRLTENVTEGTVQRKKRRKRKKKPKTKDKIESVDQMDDELEGPKMGISCTVPTNDLQNNIIKLVSTARLREEHSKMDTNSIENLTEGTVPRKKRKRKQKKKKAKNRDELQSVDEMDSNLEVPNIGISCTVVNNDLQNNLVKLDSAARLQAEESKMGTRSTENLAEGTIRRKGRWRKQNKRRAKNKDELQSVDLTSSLNLSDENNATGNNGKLIKNESTTSLMHLVHDTSGPVGLDNHKKTALAPVEVEISNHKSYSDFLEKGSGPLEGPREMEVEKFPCVWRHMSLPNEKSGKNERIDNDFKEEEIIVYRGKGSAASSSRDVELTKQFSSVLKEGDHLSKNLWLHLEIPPVAFARRKLLVLDVNGLLADIVMPAPKDCAADTRILGRAIFRRPFCNDFLKFCFEKFDVAIWSSRSKRIIEKVVNYLLGNLQDKLLFCWDMSHSTQTSFKTLENVHKPLVMKELKKIWEKDDPNLPWEKGYYDESNTLLLDDSPYKALLNPLHTAIFPNSYHYKDKSDISLGPGGDLRVYLEEMLKCDNVQKYVEQHPFGQGAIDETNAFWSFYSKVLQSVSTASV